MMSDLTAANPLLLELHAAVRLAAPQLKRRSRARLEFAARDVIVAAGLGQIRLVPATREALCQQLRRFIELASDARVDWAEFVSIVNREWPHA